MPNKELEVVLVGRPSQEVIDNAIEFVIRCIRAREEKEALGLSGGEMIN